MFIRPVMLCSLLSVLLFGMTGCLSTGGTQASLTKESVEANLIVGKTTEAEVRQIYGEPDTISTGNNESIWSYTFGPSFVDGLISDIAGNATGKVIGSAAGAAAGAFLQSPVPMGNTALQLGMKAQTETRSVVDSTLGIDKKTRKLTVMFNKSGVVTDYFFQE